LCREDGGIEVVEEEGIAELEGDIHGGERCQSMYVLGKA